MTDVGIGSAIESVGSEAGSMLSRLFGPTLDLMGSQMAHAYRRRHLRRVIEKSAAKAKLKDSGSIPPRVAQEVFEKAQWADNEFTAEYFSGVLASARSAEGKNDSAVAWTAMVGRLSSDQLALHWLLASGLQLRTRQPSFQLIWDAINRQIVLGLDEIFEHLDWSLTTDANTARFLDAVYGLRREGLITDVSHGLGDYLGKEVAWTKGRIYSPRRSYLTCRITSDGVGLVMQAVGLGGRWIGDFLGMEMAEAVNAIEGMPVGLIAQFVSDFEAVDGTEAQRRL